MSGALIRGSFLVATALAVAGCRAPGHTAPGRQPVIDAHLHAFGSDWAKFFKDTSWFPPGRATDSDSLREQTLRLLAEYNVVKAVASGTDQAIINRWHSAAPDRIIPALVLGLRFATPLDTLRARLRDGSIQVLGEAIWQFEGVALDDRRLEPFWALAEAEDVPLGVHLGPGPPGIQREWPFRARLGDPLLLEEVLVRHPRLRLWVMHAGWPQGDRMVALLASFPEVYVDIAELNTGLPRPEFHAYLRRLVDAGFGRKIMYGSDQAIWPAMIPLSIGAIESAEFLSPDEKRDILCRNAVRFFRLEPSLCESP